MKPELTVIIPTYNEAPNVAPLADRLAATLDGIDWRAIFVDDQSPDGTAEAVAAAAERDSRVSCLSRTGKRGLSAAVIDGVAACRSEFFAVMDGDLQHDERLLPQMFAGLAAGDADLIIASRYVAGGGTGDWRGDRVVVSRVATRIAQIALGVTISDPMSGFFASKRGLFVDAAPAMSGKGFKILLDFMTASRKNLRTQEIPMQFQPRSAGESKLDWRVALQFLQMAGARVLPRYR